MLLQQQPPLHSRHTRSSGSVRPKGLTAPEPDCRAGARRPRLRAVGLRRCRHGTAIAAAGAGMPQYLALACRHGTAICHAVPARHGICRPAFAPRGDAIVPA
jgi:hypothetical protein